MKSLAAVVRVVLFTVVIVGVLAIVAPMASASASGTGPQAKPSPKTAPRGGAEGPKNTRPGHLSGTGPREAVIELLLLGAGLLVVGAAMNRAGSKSGPARP